MKYRPDIDGLRALAVGSVVLYHLTSSWLPGGFVGVDIFFVISGFVVCGSLASAPPDRLLKFILGFYSRRLARIVPALVVVLVTTAAFATLFIPQSWVSATHEKTALFAFAGLSNMVLVGGDDYFSPRVESNPYAHTWSLGVEEQFYVVFPLICFAWVRARRSSQPSRATLMTAALGALAVVSLASCAWASSASTDAAFFTLWFRFWELAAGALLFQSGLSSKLEWPWAGFGLVVLALLCADPAHFPFPWAVPAVAGTALIIGDPIGKGHAIRRFFASPLAVWIGQRSYALYLWHWPVFILLRWTRGLDGWPIRVLALSVTFALASASFSWLEVPLRRNVALGRLPLFGRVAFFVLLSAVGWKVADGILWRHEMLGLSVLSRQYDDWYVQMRMPSDTARPRRCAVRIDQVSEFGEQKYVFIPERCDGTPSVSGEPALFVVGDSHAFSYRPLFDQIAAETGRRVSLYTKAGCAYLELLAPMSESSISCRTYLAAVTQELRATVRPGDILFLASLRMRRFVGPWTKVDEPDAWSVLTPAGLAGVERARIEASQVVKGFVSAGAGVLFEAPKPLLKSPPFRCADWFDAMNPICGGGLTQPRVDIEKLREPVLAVMRSLALGEAKVQVWDPLPVLCPGEICSAEQNGRPLFFDGDHITGYGNVILLSSFRSALTTFEGWQMPTPRRMSRQ